VKPAREAGWNKNARVAVRVKDTIGRLVPQNSASFSNQSTGVRSGCGCPFFVVKEWGIEI
jgi:hypothetical protein